MKCSALLALCACLSVLGPCTAEDAASQTASSSIIELTDGSFDARTSDGNAWLLMIYSPRCIHCKRLLPILEEFASSSDVKTAKLDGDYNGVTALRFHVTHYPSVYLIRDGKVWTLHGSLSAPEIGAFVTEGYRDEKPWPWYTSPLQPLSRVYGVVLGLPSLAANLYTDVRERSGWTDFQLAGSGLGAIMVLGVAFIIGLDQYYAANPHLLADLHQD